MNTEEPLIARDATYHRAPDGLRNRVRASLRASARAERRRFFWPVLGSGFACAAAAAITWSVALTTLQVTDSDRLQQEIVTAHVRSLMAPNHLADVVSTDQHTVKPWFAGKVDFAPPVTDYAASGFVLTGGRLDYIEGRAAAAITYRHRQHVVNFFVWPAKDAPDLEPHNHSRQGYSLVGWTRAGMRYCVIADISGPELSQLVELIRAG